MTKNFVPDEVYSDLLLENSKYHLRVREGKASYTSSEWFALQRKLTEIEVKMSAEDIINHAEYLFPKVGP